MRNKWKIAFWFCLLLFIITGVIGLYSIIDQGVTTSHMRDGYSDTEADLETLIEIIEKTDQTKKGIKNILKKHKIYEFMDFDKDTISLERVSLIFKNDSLKEIKKQW